MIKTYNDYLRNLLSKIDCILALETSADYLGLSNGGYREYAQIYVTKKYKIKDTKQIIIPSFSNIEYIEMRGLKVTTINQTIIDMLSNNCDEQILIESLANYLDEYKNFDGLKIPNKLENYFEKLKYQAEIFYTED